MTKYFGDVSRLAKAAVVVGLGSSLVSTGVASVSATGVVTTSASSSFVSSGSTPSAPGALASVACS